MSRPTLVRVADGLSWNSMHLPERPRYNRTGTTKRKSLARQRTKPQGYQPRYNLGKLIHQTILDLAYDSRGYS
jgi:hypothetical protein